MASQGKRRVKQGKPRETVSERVLKSDRHAKPGAKPKRPPDTHCNARTAAGYCRNPAGKGTEHLGFGRCSRHGGSTANGASAAKEAELEVVAETYGLPIEVDPQTALLQELYRTAGHVAYLGAMVAELGEHELHGPVGTAGSSEGKTYFPGSEPHVLLKMYHTERQHMARVAKSCIEAGIEERRVRLAEEQGQLIARVIEGVLSDLGIERTPEVGKTVAKRLELVA